MFYTFLTRAQDRGILCLCLGRDMFRESPQLSAKFRYYNIYNEVYYSVAYRKRVPSGKMPSR